MLMKLHHVYHILTKNLKQIALSSFFAAKFFDGLCTNLSVSIRNVLHMQFLNFVISHLPC